MCTDRQDVAAQPYATVLQQRGCRVLRASLFVDSAVKAALPDTNGPLREALVVIPSPRAAVALARQSWFPDVRSSLRIITPGPETSQAVRALGITPVWSATGGFRREGLPAALEAHPKIYLGNRALTPTELSIKLDPQRDLFVPIYHRALSLLNPWTPATARELMQAPALSVLALSPSQRQGFESLLTKLGAKRPDQLRLIGLTARKRTRFSAKFWTEMAFPESSNRLSMLELLKSLAF